MKVGRLPSSRDERGAALILAIAFMLVVGAVSLATLSYITSGVSQRRVLDDVRDREYAADGAVNYAIAQVRTIPAPGPGVASCGGPYRAPAVPKLNNVNVRVDCVNSPTLTDHGFLQRNVIFTACVDSGQACTDANAVVRAQVNYEATSFGSSVSVTRTWVQSWSVNR